MNAVVHYTVIVILLPCLTYGNFSVVKEEQKLTGHIIATLNNVSADECESVCLKHRQCKSMNIKRSIGVNCELNDKSSEDPFDNVMLNTFPGWIYRSTDYEEKNIGHYCQYRKPCDTFKTCTDTCSYPGYQCHTTVTAFKGCQEAYDYEHRTTGLYPIHNTGMPLFFARCDMEADRFGWILFQRRVSTSTGFDRGWNEYKSGFGDLNGNFWLGLDKLEKLAGPRKNAILRVDLMHLIWPKVKRYAQYRRFEISNEAQGYKLTISGYSGNAGNSLRFYNGKAFSTKDRGNYMNYAKKYLGGWWYTNVLRVNLNSIFPTSTENNARYMSWYGFCQRHGGIFFSEMKIKYPSP